MLCWCGSRRICMNLPQVAPKICFGRQSGEAFGALYPDRKALVGLYQEGGEYWQLVEEHIRDLEAKGYQVERREGHVRIEKDGTSLEVSH